MGYGIGYLPDFMAQSPQKFQKAFLDIKPIAYAICCIRLKEAPLSRASESFLQLLQGIQKACNTLPSRNYFGWL